MSMQYMDPRAALELIEAQGNRVFQVTFVKRTNGELRKMVCRRHVSKGVKGVLAPGVRKEQDAAAAVLTVYEFPNGEFKRISLDSIVSITAQGSTST